MTSRSLIPSGRLLDTGEYKKNKSCLAADFVVLDNDQNKRNNFASESRRLQVKVCATNFAEKNHMIKNSVKNLSHFISLKTFDIWNIELQRNQLLT